MDRGLGTPGSTRLPLSPTGRSAPGSLGEPLSGAFNVLLSLGVRSSNFSSMRPNFWPGFAVGLLAITTGLTSFAGTAAATPRAGRTDIARPPRIEVGTVWTLDAVNAADCQLAYISRGRVFGPFPGITGPRRQDFTYHVADTRTSIELNSPENVGHEILFTGTWDASTGSYVASGEASGWDAFSPGNECPNAE
jgi:hypothetical protein